MYVKIWSLLLLSIHLQDLQMKILYVYKATGLTKKRKIKAALDEDEFVELMEVSLEEATTLMKDLRIHDAKTMFAVQYLQLQK